VCYLPQLRSSNDRTARTHRMCTTIRGVRNTIWETLDPKLCSQKSCSNAFVEALDACTSRHASRVRALNRYGGWHPQGAGQGYDATQDDTQCAATNNVSIPALRFDYDLHKVAHALVREASTVKYICVIHQVASIKHTVHMQHHSCSSQQQICRMPSANCNSSSTCGIC
jgi:hypothetical protein